MFTDERSNANRAVVHRFVQQLWNERNLGVADEIFTQDCTVHAIQSLPFVRAEIMRGPEHIKPIVTTYCSAFPDWYVTIEEMVADEDKIMLWSTAQGTFQREFMHIHPTGQQVTWTGIRIFRLMGGKIAEYWQLWDWLGLYQQLGIVSERAQLLPKARS